MVRRKSYKGGVRQEMPAAGNVRVNTPKGDKLKAEEAKQREMADLLRILKFGTPSKHRPDYTLEELRMIKDKRAAKESKPYTIFIGARSDTEVEKVGRFNVQNGTKLNSDLNISEWKNTFMNMEYNTQPELIGDFDLISFLKQQFKNVGKENRFSNKNHSDNAIKFIEELGNEKIKEFNKKIGLHMPIKYNKKIGKRESFSYVLRITEGHNKYTLFGGKKTKKTNKKKKRTKKKSKK